MTREDKRKLRAAFNTLNLIREDVKAKLNRETAFAYAVSLDVMDEVLRNQGMTDVRVSIKEEWPETCAEVWEAGK